MKKSHYKQPEQVEACEIILMLRERHKMRPADIARELGVTDSAISQILSGATGATRQTLTGLRKLKREREDPKPRQSPAQLALKLEDIEKHDPPGYIACESAIDVIHGKINFSSGGKSRNPSDIPPREIQPPEDHLGPGEKSPLP